MKKILCIALTLMLSITTMFGASVTAKAEEKSGPSIIESTTVNVNYAGMTGVGIGNPISDLYYVIFTSASSAAPRVELEWNEFSVKAMPEHVKKGYISQDVYDCAQEESYGWVACNEFPSDYIMNETDVYGVVCHVICYSSEWVFSKNINEDVTSRVKTTTSGVTIEKAVSKPHMSDDPMVALVYLNLGTGAQLNAKINPGSSKPVEPNPGGSGSQSHSHSYSAYKTTTKATFGKAGKQVSTCSICKATKSKTIPAVKTPTLSTSTYKFNNKAKKPTVTVKDSKGVKLTKVTSTSKNGFTVKYASGRKKVGKYSVKITLTGANYTGTKTVYFKINPKGVSISKLSKAKKAFTVKWKKPSSTYRKQMTGYQIRYSTSSKMKKAKTVTVKSTSTTSKKISKLKAKKTYYVQIRTYKKVGSTKYYSDWSKAKKVKTK